jgi:ketosteroid isomerase-like protein
VVTTTDDASTREVNKEVLRRAMAAVTALDTDAVLAEMDASAIFSLPFEPLVPDTDMDGYRQLLTATFTMFKKFEVTITDIYDLVDPNVVIARYRSDSEGRDKPVVYQNNYIGVFDFRDGKMTSWREWANPEVSHAAIAGFADDAPAVHA